ncbi:hypothetical protein [Acidocella sp. KAb 2-4]|uniref:hypothetical protein n=1 Tax=Acidocella sp. KAb 2-4 TaxID=2885158 RepID=UPI001D05F606|nr:hypothetical protein [Acidocella sp. KAb 2-4]MCB5945638.1 hypothetical protein [Acidocella sp. KAb 2-4]
MISFIASVVLLVQLANLANVLLHSGMGHGAGLDTFLADMHDPWQNFINSDLVMGLLFSLSWLIFRERGKRRVQTIAWVWMAAWWGNIVIAIYALKAAREAQGAWPVFFMGSHSPNASARTNRPAPLPLRLLCLGGVAVTLIYIAHGLLACAFATVPATGYLAGFLPIALSLALLGLPAQR